MFSFIWPILLVVASNTAYHMIAKSTPANASAFASLTITYLTAAVSSVVIFYMSGSGKSLMMAIKDINWTSFALGISIIGLEFGYVQVYRAGWNISVGSLVANIMLAVILVIVGLLIYREAINLNKIIGIALCIVGIIFLNKN